MSRASEVLRGRALAMDVTTSDVSEVSRAHADEYRAIADLLDATSAYIAWTEGEGHGESGHDAWLMMRNALAAVERVITGERE